MNDTLRQRILTLLFWLWVVGILGLYIGSFGPLLRMLVVYFMP